MIVWYIMIQATLYLLAFLALLQQALYTSSVDTAQTGRPLIEATAADATAAIAIDPAITVIPANNNSSSSSTATTDATNKADGSPEENLLRITQLPGLDKLAVPNGEYLRPFLVPRVVDTDSHRRVQAYIRSTFTKLGWDVQEDRFRARTPVGTKNFNNIIATKFPEATNFLLLSAHYDSKYFPPPDENKFVAATDSAVPCALLIDLATSLNPILDRLRGTGRGVRIVFFDGEEAFREWTSTDSIYGSRHLAEVWSQRQHPGVVPPRTFIQSIQLFVLLDLLGVADNRLVDLIPETVDEFSRMATLERRLAALGVFGTKGQLTSGPIPPAEQVEKDAAGQYIFVQTGASRSASGIQDDHLPFMNRGVRVVHLIPPKFPDAWHTLGDNADSLDPATIRQLALVLRAFVVDYLGLMKLQ